MGLVGRLRERGGGWYVARVDGDCGVVIIGLFSCDSVDGCCSVLSAISQLLYRHPHGIGVRLNCTNLAEAGLCVLGDSFPMRLASVV